MTTKDIQQTLSKREQDFHKNMVNIRYAIMAVNDIFYFYDKEIKHDFIFGEDNVLMLKLDNQDVDSFIEVAEKQRPNLIIKKLYPAILKLNYAI